MTIPPDKDPIGNALLDYLKGSHDKYITVRSDISEDDIIPVNYFFRDFEKMPELEQKALLLCKGKVLDIGAGSGSHSLYLQNKDIDVTALDMSELSCKCCEKRGVHKVINEDYFELTGKQKYDTLLMLMNGIGIAGSIDNLDRFFSIARELLNPGGSVLLDSSDIKYMFEDDEEEMENIITGSNDFYYGEVTYIMEYKGITSDPFDWLFIDPGLLNTIAINNRFKFELLSHGPNNDYLARLTPLN